MRILRFAVASLVVLFAATPAGAQTVHERALGMNTQQRYEMCVTSASKGSSEAIEWCTIALKSRLTINAESRCHAWRAKAYERAGNLDAALQDLNYAVSLADGYRSVGDGMGNLRTESVKDPAPLFEQRGVLLFKLKNFQAAVAFYHWSKRNPAGAMSLYRSSTRHLTKYRPAYLGVDVEDFLRRYMELFQWLRRHRVPYDARLVPTIRWVHGSQ